MGDSYTTLADIRARINNDKVDAALDALLTDIISQVSTSIDMFVFGPVGQVNKGFINAVDVTEFYDGGFDAVVLRQLFTDDLTARDTIKVFEDGTELTIDVDFQIDDFPSRTVRRTFEAEKFAARFTVGQRNIKVIYRPAYAILPDDIRRVADEETIRAFKGANTNAGDGGSIGITQRTPDAGTSLTYGPDDFTPTTLRILRQHRDRLQFF